MKLQFLPQREGRRVIAFRAFSLVELMVASALLAVMMAVCYTSFVTGFSSIKSTREDLRATQIMAQKLEAIRLCNWTTQLSNFPTTFSDYYNPNGVTNQSQGVSYSGRVSTTGIATNIPDSAAYKSQVHLVTISITWTDRLSTDVVHTRTMQSLVAQNGMQNYIWGN